MNPSSKYKQFDAIKLPDRAWPNNIITKAPLWCSVDLRDGNQALVNPMNIEQKLEFFDMLVKIGFKEIEVGFPSSSDTEFRFIRRLIDEGHVTRDVTLQVLCQAREHLIKRTFESLVGCKNVIFHLYNSTSPAQRKYTFNKSKEEIKQIAIDGIHCVKDCIDGSVPVRLEYSPESFSTTELDYALEVCEAVKSEWLSGNNTHDKVILNLPTTVESCMPNQFADSIEYFCRHISDRANTIISLHNHNDRGEGVAQCELGLLAGADRVEGCLFGNGERTGNLDIVTVALNMYTQGVDPNLDFSDLTAIANVYTRLTGMTIPVREPYAGSLVFTAFSGSHQDAIRKAMAKRVGSDNKTTLWDVPYLTLDPHDIGRQYEGIIRINSQSGKGGAAFIMEQNYGICMPRSMQSVFGTIIKGAADIAQRELQVSEIYDKFCQSWLTSVSPLSIVTIKEDHSDSNDNSNTVKVAATIKWDGNSYDITGEGNGPLDAFCNALKNTPAPKFTITTFSEHSIGTGNDTNAMAYVMITTDKGEQIWGAGKSPNVGRAGINAVVSAINYGY